MNRKTGDKLAQDLGAKDLARVTGRQLERLSQAKMLIDNEPLDRLAGRLAQLDALGWGPGKGVEQKDHIARVLLTRGYPCPAVRLAIARSLTGLRGLLALPSAPEAQLLASLLAQSDHRELARLSTNNTGHAMARVISTLADLTATGGHYDSFGALLGPTEETPEQRRQVITHMAVQVAASVEVDDPTPAIDFVRLTQGKAPLAIEDIGRPVPAKPWPSPLGHSTTAKEPHFEEEDGVRSLLLKIGPAAAQLLNTLITAPLTELAEAAEKGRPLLGQFLPLFGEQLDDEMLDDKAAVFAPSVLGAYKLGLLEP